MTLKQYKKYTDIENEIKSAEFTSDSDKDWWEGVLYGCYKCGIIREIEKEALECLVKYVQERNINQGGK